MEYNKPLHNPYKIVKMFEEEEKQKPITISPENKFSNSNTMIEQNIKSENDLSDLTVDPIYAALNFSEAKFK